MRINEAGIVTTYRCNSKCLMCGIWKRQEPYELEAGYFNRLPSYLKLIGLTGGEPFLREDIVQVYRITRNRCPSAKITLGSNGLATDLIRERMEEILKFDKSVNVIISLDGIGRAHDQVRGIEGAYEKVLRTIGALKKIGLKNLGLNFTILNENLEEMAGVYDLSRKLGLKISFVPAHNSDIYYKSANQPLADPGRLAEQLDYIISGELASFNIKRWLKSYYLAGIADFVNYGKRFCACSAGELSLFIDSNGDIYPCLAWNKKLGNLKEIDFEKMAKLRQGLLTGRCPDPCWLGCSVYPVLRKKPYLALVWFGRRKINLN